MHSLSYPSHNTAHTGIKPGLRDQARKRGLASGRRGRKAVRGLVRCRNSKYKTVVQMNTEPTERICCWRIRRSSHVKIENWRKIGFSPDWSLLSRHDAGAKSTITRTIHIAVLSRRLDRLPVTQNKDRIVFNLLLQTLLNCELSTLGVRRLRMPHEAKYLDEVVGHTHQHTASGVVTLLFAGMLA